jgi:hypothetical protein
MGSKTALVLQGGTGSRKAEPCREKWPLDSAHFCPSFLRAEIDGSKTTERVTPGSGRRQDPVQCQSGVSLVTRDAPARRQAATAPLEGPPAEPVRVRLLR